MEPGMLFWRTLTEKSLSPKLVGKMRRFRLTRGDGAVAFTGELLACRRHADQEDAPEYPGICHLLVLALFRTRKGRFVVYYIVDYTEDEHISGEHQYVTLLSDFSEVARFVAAMSYVNAPDFREKVLSDAQARLSPTA
jgi:hypothetical protein